MRTPDIAGLDDAVISHWQDRTKQVTDPVMKARYADLIWDLKKAITGQPAPYEYAQVAIDAYMEATQKRLCSTELAGAHWLNRALSLALSINDRQRTSQVVTAIFAFYDAIADPHRAGVWVFPFDTLYDKKDFLTPEQQNRIIAHLESMLQRTASQGKEFDPFGAQAAAERLARHYKSKNDKANAQRVIKTCGEAFEKLARDASPMLA